MTSNNVTLSTSLATVNCSALLECAACATERVCAWLADTEAATGSCIVRTPAMHVVAPWHLVRNATACPVYATSAQLLFDPAMLVMLISICGALWLGARRSVSASHGGANGSNGNADENGNSNSAPNVTQHMHSHLRDMRLTPKRIAMPSSSFRSAAPRCCCSSIFSPQSFTIVCSSSPRLPVSPRSTSCLPYCRSLALRFAPARAAAPFHFARRRVSVASVVAAALSALFVALWLASNYWLFINLVALAVGVAALERAPIPAVRYTFLLGMLLLVYDCFWVFATILRPATTTTRCQRR
jgi:hypothetical protein